MAKRADHSWWSSRRRVVSGRALLVGVLVIVALLGLSARPAAAAGGPVILGGDDLTDHGGRDTATNVNLEGWLYLEKALENIKPSVTRPGNNGSIAALGSTDSTNTSADAGAAMHFAAQDAGSGIPVTYYDGGPAMEQFFADLRSGVAKPAIIWIAGNGSSNDLSSDASEPQALVNNATTIGDFVNSGGGLMSHGSEYGWLFGLFPNASAPPGGASGDLELTPQGTAAFPGLTNSDVNAGPWHNSFEGDLGGLATLVRSTTEVDPQGNPARVIVGGAGVVLPGSIVLDPPTAQNLVGTSHTVTATVRNDQGQVQTGTLVTFTVISGPNQGDTGTGTTNSGGQATFSWTGDGGEGVDTVQASFVDASSNTRTTTATKTWFTVVPIPILSPTSLLPVLIASGLVVVWRRRRRQLA